MRKIEGHRAVVEVEAAILGVSLAAAKAAAEDVYYRSDYLFERRPRQSPAQHVCVHAIVWPDGSLASCVKPLFHDWQGATTEERLCQAPHPNGNGSRTWTYALRPEGDADDDAVLARLRGGDIGLVEHQREADVAPVRGPAVARQRADEERKRQDAEARQRAEEEQRRQEELARQKVEALGRCRPCSMPMKDGVSTAPIGPG